MPDPQTPGAEGSEPQSAPKRNPMLWVIVAIILLTVSGMAVTIAISVHNNVSDGFIPREER